MPRHARLGILRSASVCIFVVLAALWLVTWLTPEPGSQIFRLVARICGYLGFLCMLVPYAHIVRRWIRHRPIGENVTWLKWHVAAAYLAFFFVLVHSRARATTGLTLALQILFWAVMISGVVGYYGQKLLYYLLPRLLVREIGRERLELQRQFLLQRGRVVAASAAISDWEAFSERLRKNADLLSAVVVGNMSGFGAWPEPLREELTTEALKATEKAARASAESALKQELAEAGARGVAPDDLKALEKKHRDRIDRDVARTIDNLRHTGVEKAAAKDLEKVLRDKIDGCARGVGRLEKDIREAKRTRDDFWTQLEEVDGKHRLLEFLERGLRHGKDLDSDRLLLLQREPSVDNLLQRKGDSLPPEERAFADFADAALQFCLRPFPSVIGRERRWARNSLSENRYLQLWQMSEPRMRGLVGELWETIGQRRQLDLEHRLHQLGRLWLLVHGPAAWALLILMIEHVFMSMRYGGY